ncbi:hypothetical protein K492DRAFT_191067 [Lichtheimia hyalospora FSU 10163]|nr:hypothetical protein K492DRAFT_191067 [Lichtheimia hyalospora FSU 10163]
MARESISSNDASSSTRVTRKPTNVSTSTPLPPQIPWSEYNSILWDNFIVYIAKGDMKEEEFTDFIRELQEAPTDFHAVPLEDADRLTLRKKYNRVVSSDKQVMGETCTYEEMLALAEHSGRMCTRSHIVGGFDGITVPKYRLLSFNRVHNHYGNFHQQHHSKYLEVILWICNAAMGQGSIDELKNWLKALRNSTVPTC